MEANQRKSLVLTFVKQVQNFASVCIRMVIIVICLFVGSISDGFSATESISLGGNVHDFSVHYNANDKSDILNIQYLMVKNNMK